ncbi:phosphoprotein phosphatase 1 domain protein [Dictyocaulus viviparus]|uniref:Serine/threonine-protein phosphatase n=1 Tax=Dictyocaulus viviparus TaxID=29172 RepID=A0A0D8XQX8_DICVI|nr:phosphoprotein phosphatase 1 domain protein [Dictyocaulus viviparus]
MVENGPREFDFDRQQLIDILRLGAEIFIQECSLIEVPVPCIIYGDTHGQYSDLLRWFNLNGWPNVTRSVFLGDFVDRGSHGVELFALLTCLKVCFPDNIFVIRGNHEEESLNQLYSFVAEVYMKFDAKKNIGGTQSMYEHFNNVFMNLPLACIIGGEILAMHGGISPKLNTLQDIRDIRRPIDEFEKGTLACDLVWSDPDTLNKVIDFEPNLEREATVGIGQLFSQSAVKEACKRLGVKMIVRGHQVSNSPVLIETKLSSCYLSRITAMEKIIHIGRMTLLIVAYSGCFFCTLMKLFICFITYFNVSTSSSTMISLSSNLSSINISTYA